MSERAVWRRGPDEGTTWLAYLVADRERYLGDSLRGLGCLTGPGGLFLLFSGRPLVGLGLFAVTCLLPFVRRARRKDVTSLITLPAPARPYTCSIEVTGGGGTLGRDRGVVTFIEGWLHYEGFRTSFSVSRDDALKRDQNALRLKGCGVAFASETAGFAAELDRWYRLSPAAKGVSVLPPDTLHPSGRVRAQADLAAHTLLGLGTLAVCAVFLVHWEVWTAFVGILAVLRLWNSAVEVRNAARFLRKRRSLPNVAQDGDGLLS